MPGYLCISLSLNKPCPMAYEVSKYPDTTRGNLTWESVNFGKLIGSWKLKKRKQVTWVRPRVFQAVCLYQHSLFKGGVKNSIDTTYP